MNTTTAKVTVRRETADSKDRDVIVNGVKVGTVRKNTRSTWGDVSWHFTGRTASRLARTNWLP